MSLNRVAAEPELKDLLDAHRKEILLSLNCHAIGTIQEFDKDKQTASVTINYKKTFYQQIGTTGTYSPVLVDYPLLVDCPVVVLGGGPCALTFPIAQGDECSILFNDRDIDNWFLHGQTGEVATSRLHSLSDGIVLVGVRSSLKVIGNYDPDRGVLRNGTTRVGVGASHVQIANGTTSLNAVLQNLISAINGIVISGTSLSAPSIAALNAVGAQIGGLLE